MSGDINTKSKLSIAEYTKTTLILRQKMCPSHKPKVQISETKNETYLHSHQLFENIMNSVLE